MDELRPYVEFHGNMFVKNAINSHSTGLKVQFRLRNEDDLEIFKGVTKRRKGKAGQVYRMHYKAVGAENWKVADCWFLGATWSHNNGAVVAFMLSDVTEWQDFRDWPGLGDGAGTEAQEIELLLFRVGDNGELVNIRQRNRIETINEMKGGPQSIRAARMIADPEFKRYMAALINNDENLPVSDKFINDWVCKRCRITSKKELDHDGDKLARFNQMVSGPFIRWSSDNE